jgi:hypothetical protein
MINLADDSRMLILQKVRSCDPVIFLEKVRDIGTAEGDIRKAFGIPLGQGFVDKFLESIDEEQKKRFKADSGMTEWVVMDAQFAAHLQRMFHSQFFPSDILNILPWPRGTPSGEEIHRQLFSQGHNYYSQRIGSISLPPEFHISFPPTKFSYTLRTPT